MKTLFVLPNAIGDAICGTGIARYFAADGPVTWFVNPTVAGVLDHEPVTPLESPSARVRRMVAHGASTEIAWRECDRFLSTVQDSGPWDRVINVHLSRAASLVAGAASARATTVRGPALTDRVYSHAWTDFFLSSVVQGVAPELPVPTRFSLIAGLARTSWPDWSAHPSRAAASGGIAFVPGSGWPSKALGAEQAARIAERLLAIAPVTLIGGPKESSFLEDVRHNSGDRCAIVPVGNLSATIASLLQARAVVTADTWSLHAACAARIPVLALLGPTRIMPWHHGLALSPDEPASWKNDDDRSIERIGADDVAACAAALLAKADPPRPVQGTILWDCRVAGADPDWPRPHRPPALSAMAAERELLAWARGRAFNACMKRFQPGEPRMASRPVERVPEIVADFETVARRARDRLADEASRFPLYDTTFPGEDAERVTKVWIEETAAELTRLIES